MSDSTTYIIVTAESLEALAIAVEAKKQEGYVVSGAPYVTDTGYAQSMILASALSPIDFPESVVDITGAYIGSRTKESGNPVYYVGDKVEPEEYSATLELKSGATRSLFQDDFYVSPREISSTSDTTVKVIYKWEKGFEDDVTIAPKAVALTSIVVQDMPRKTTYVVGQTFTGYDGLEVTALYNNNSLKRLPAGSYTVNPSTITTTFGTKTVTVSYTEGSVTKQTTFNIEVVKNTPVALEVLGNAKLQYVGKPIDASGLTFKATMLDGSVKDVTSDVDFDDETLLTDIGTKAVTFSYTENGVTASVVKYFNVTTMKPVALTMTGEFTPQYINTAVNLTGLAFKAVYDNGDAADVTSSIMVTPSTWSSTVGIQAVVFTYSASGVTLTLTKSVEVKEAPQGSNYVKCSSTTPFKFAPAEWVEGDGEGEEIVPTGTFNNVYLNCDATVEEVEEAFGAIPSEQWAGDDWDQYANSYFAFCAGVIGTDPADAILIQKSELSSGNYGYGVMFMGIGSSSSMQYIFMPEQVQEMGVPEAGWYTYDPNTFQFTKTSGIKEFTPDEPRVGMSRIEVEAYSLSYDVGLSNDKLKKIFSFNKTFSTVGYQPVSADTTRWDGTLQYHIGSEPSENTEWIDFPAEGEACDWIEVGSDPGKKIVPTGTFTKVYLNCDATVEDVEKAFGAIPENQFTGSENWGEWMYKYFAFSAGLYVESSGLKTYSSIMIGKLGTTGWMVSFLDYDERKKDYYFFSEAIPESPFSEPGWYDGNTYEKLTGVIEFADATTEGPQQGSSHISASVAGYSVSYDVGLSNDLLTKIFSFNEPFGEAVEPNLYIRGINNTTIVGEDVMVAFQTKAIGSSSPQISLSGKLMALFNYEDPESAVLPSDNFGVQYLFSYDENLTDASQLILPSRLSEPYVYKEEEGLTVTNGCLSGMFSYCTSLTAAPVLPATTLTGNCYQDMFSDCTSLTAAPELPATALATQCYDGMFAECTSLTAAPELPATELKVGCYGNMFEGCTSLTTAPTLLATDLTSYCYNNMFSGCAALTAIPELPATTLAASCYYHMFDGCTSIKLSQSQTEECQTLYRIPREGTGITADSALDGMFSGAIYDPEDGWLDEDGTPDFTNSVWEGYVGSEAIPTGVVNFATKKYKTWGKLWWEDDQDKTIIADHKYTITIIGSDLEDHVFEHMTAYSVDGYADCAIGDARIYASTEYDDVPFTISKGLFWGDYLGYRLDTSLLDVGEEFDIEIYDETSGEYLKERDEEGYLYYYAEDEYVDEGSGYWYCLHHCIDTSELVLGNLYTLRVNNVNYEHLELREDEWAGTGYCIGDEDFEAVPVYICKSNSGTDEGDCVYEIRYKSSVFPFNDDSIITVSIIPESAPQSPNYLKYSSTTPFKFAPIADGDPIQQGTPRWDGTLQYSVDGENWTDFSKTGDCDWIEAQESGGNYNIYLRGINNSTVVGIDEDEYAVVKFRTQAVEDGDNPAVSVSGKLMALFDYASPESKSLPSDKYGVQYLFAYDANLTDASGLALPSVLADPYNDGYDNYGCMYGMFQGCTSLTTAPAILPAEELTRNCYEGMFQDCTKLAAAPELPATTLADYCYRDMFNGCTSLVTVSELPATVPADYCCYMMFCGCTSLTTLPRIYLTGSAESACDNMFRSCSGITLSETQTGDYQTAYLIPNLSGNNALHYMFGQAGGPFPTGGDGTPTAGTTYYTSNTVV